MTSLLGSLIFASYLANAAGFFSPGGGHAGLSMPLSLDQNLAKSAAVKTPDDSQERKRAERAVEKVWISALASRQIAISA